MKANAEELPDYGLPRSSVSKFFIMFIIYDMWFVFAVFFIGLLTRNIEPNLSNMLILIMSLSATVSGAMVFINRRKLFTIENRFKATFLTLKEQFIYWVPFIAIMNWAIAWLNSTQSGPVRGSLFVIGIALAIILVPFTRYAIRKFLETEPKAMEMQLRTRYSQLLLKNNTLALYLMIFVIMGVIVALVTQSSLILYVIILTGMGIIQIPVYRISAKNSTVKALLGLAGGYITYGLLIYVAYPRSIPFAPARILATHILLILVEIWLIVLAIIAILAAFVLHQIIGRSAT